MYIVTCVSHIQTVTFKCILSYPRWRVIFLAGTGGSMRLMLLSSTLGCNVEVSSVGRSRYRLTGLLVHGICHEGQAREDIAKCFALSERTVADCSLARSNH